MRRSKLAVAVAVVLAAAAPATAQEEWVPKGTADLVLLDKIKGQPTDMTVKVGETASFGSLSISVKGCVVRPPDQAADAAAYVDVTDTRGNADIFHGWILAKTPSVSQMEHPVYDLRLSGCR